MIKINVISGNKAWFQHIRYPDKYIESKIREKGKKFEETELNELDKYWKEAKGKE